MNFRLLPIDAKKALIQYFVLEGDADGFSDVDRDGTPTSQQWSQLIARADDVWSNENYELNTLSLADAKAFVWEHSPDIQDEHDSFDEYHACYISGGDIPEHADSSWPVLAMPSCEEALLDGWHRFHSYVIASVNEIDFINLDA